MSRVLNGNVWVGGVLYPVGSTPPADVAAKIGDHAWDDVADAPSPTPAAKVTDDLVKQPLTGPPPLHGKGSNLKAWSDYAFSNGFDVDDEWTRGDLISALAAAGIPTE